MTVTSGALLIAALLLPVACGRDDAAAPGGAGTPEAPGSGSAPFTERNRLAALKSARVWRQPAVPIAQANLKDNPPGAGAFPTGGEVSCRLVLEPVGGTTPKFNCELPGSDVVKVKYGAANPELHAEVAASRLLNALGFGADRMYLVRKVHCSGCPALPFVALKCLAETGLQAPCFAGGLDYEHNTTLEPAVIERRFPGHRIEAANQGWAWYELDLVDAARGGSPAADLDAFRLIAVMLAHWDNKAENQRLVCLPGGRRGDGSCGASFAIIQDLGATFGPDKLDLHNWRETPIWSDRRSCAVSMKHLPFAGATFPERRISEAGRRKLLGLLEQVSEPQLLDLFTGSGVTSYNHLNAAARHAGAWTAAFLDKVRQIREGGPCGS